MGPVDEEVDFLEFGSARLMGFNGWSRTRTRPEIQAVEIARGRKAQLEPYLQLCTAVHTGSHSNRETVEVSRP